MKKQLVIIGASGHGKVVADIASKTYEKIIFLDDDPAVKSCLGYPVEGNVEAAERYLEASDFFVAIGNAKIRRRISEQLRQKHAAIPVLVHPAAVIGAGVLIGQGTVIMPGAVINADAVIGEGCIINTSASVDHDCRVSDYVHVAVGAHLCGTVRVEEAVWIGAGATISNNVSICKACMIGAGAVVVKDIEEAGTYLGVPAKKIRIKS